MLKNNLQVLSLIYHTLTTLTFSRTSRTKFAKSSTAILTSNDNYSIVLGIRCLSVCHSLN